MSNTKPVDEQTMSVSHKNTIKKSLRTFKYTDDEVESLASSIKEDALKRFPNETLSADIDMHGLKMFGALEGSILPDAKIMTLEVVNDTTIEYENEEGVMEFYAMDPKSLKDLAGRLEGVPVVFGEGHNADLPVAYFTGKTEVKEIDGRLALFADAKIREDDKAPINFIDLIKDPSFNVNGGSQKLGGSLKFFSKDIPVEYENGVKVNYMTGASPRHYALLNSPVFHDAGLVAKNFGKQEDKLQGEKMTEEIKDASVETVAVDATADLKASVEASLKALPVADMIKDEIVAKAVEALKLDLGQTDKVPMSDYTALKAQLTEANDKIAAIERTNLVNTIRLKELGTDASPEAVEAFEARVKEFGMNELHGYESALEVAAAQIKAAEEAAGARKDFGKARVAAEVNKKQKERKLRFGLPKDN